MLYQLNQKSYISFDKLINLSELNLIKPHICLAFAKNYDKMYATTVGGQGNWPDGSAAYLPKNPYKELSDEVRSIKTDKNHPLNQFVLDTAENVTQRFVKLMSEASGVGNSLMLNQYIGSPEIRYQNKQYSKFYPLADWAIKDFKLLIYWLNKQKIFDDIGRIILFYNDEGQQCGLHRDYNSDNAPDKIDQFLWINLFPDRKRFYLLDPDLGDKHYINDQVVMFDSRNWHGSDAHPLSAFSIRVDGIFNKNWLEKISNL